MTAPYIFPAVSEKGLGQAQGSAAFLAAAANICIGEILMVSEKQRRAAVPARAAATCGHGNMADPLIFFWSLRFFWSDVVIFSISNHSCKNISFSAMIKLSGVPRRAALKQADLNKTLCSQATGSS